MKLQSPNDSGSDVELLYAQLLKCLLLLVESLMNSSNFCHLSAVVRETASLHAGSPHVVPPHFSSPTLDSTVLPSYTVHNRYT